jgi:hypothetical protein
MSQMDTARWFLLTSYAVVATLLAVGCILDLWLEATGQATITEVWRAHPGWFWPFAIVLWLLMGVLAWHVRSS